MTWFSDMIDRWKLKQAYKWGKGRARTKLLAFYTYRETYPEMSDEELYYLTILNSVGFTEITAREVVDTASDMAEGHIGGSPLASAGEPFCLRGVVKRMLTREAFQRFGPRGYPHPDGIFEAFKAVDEVIPADI